MMVIVHKARGATWYNRDGRIAYTALETFFTDVLMAISTDMDGSELVENKCTITTSYDRLLHVISKKEKVMK